jgi:S-adenosylmethionine hydrolase
MLMVYSHDAIKNCGLLQTAKKHIFTKVYHFIMQKIITLTTDFGLSEYVAAIKGVILTINPDAKIVDISHSISPQNILEGAYVLYSTVPYFPSAVNIGVVDPGVGTERKGLIFECNHCILVGPDNGLLVPCAKKMGLKRTYSIINKDYFLDSVSDTFHGRDIFAPVASHISMGVDIEEIGEQIDEYVDLILKYHVEHDNLLDGRVVYVDRFGNIITSLAREIIMDHFSFGKTLEIELVSKKKRIKKNVKLLKSYSFEKEGELLATISSSGFFEIAANQKNASELLGIGVDADIRIKI